MGWGVRTDTSTCVGDSMLTLFSLALSQHNRYAILSTAQTALFAYG